MLESIYLFFFFLYILPDPLSSIIDRCTLSHDIENHIFCREKVKIFLSFTLHYNGRHYVMLQNL